MITDALSDSEFLGLTIIGEGRGEPIEGQVAIGCVCRNRLHSQPNKYNNYKDVCLEKEQFSCWNENDSNKPYLEELGQKLLNNIPINDIYLLQCFWVAQGVYDWKIIDNTKGALHYMTKDLFFSKRPTWAKVVRNGTEIIGKQVFFNV